MSTELFLDLIITVAFCYGTVYLLRAKKGSKKIPNVYPIGSTAHKAYEKFHTPEFLKIAMAITASQILNLIMSVIAFTGTTLPAVLRVLYFGINFALSIIILFWLYRLFATTSDKK